MRSLSATLKRIKASEGKIVTPRIDQWLIDHPEGIVIPDDRPDLWEVLARLLSAPNANRAGRFGASGRLTCQRRQVFTFLGMPGLRPHDPVQQNLFNDGNWRHIRWQMMGLLAGVLTDVEVVHHLPQYHTSVSCDGENTDEGFGFELKGSSWMAKIVEFGLPDFHRAQIETYFIATGFDTYVYVAEDKRTQDWRELVIHPDPQWTRTVKEELNALASSVEDRRLPRPLPACKAGKGEDFKSCPYAPWCIEQGQKWPRQSQWNGHKP